MRPDDSLHYCFASSLQSSRYDVAIFLTTQNYGKTVSLDPCCTANQRSGVWPIQQAVQHAIFYY